METDTQKASSGKGGLVLTFAIFFVVIGVLGVALFAFQGDSEQEKVEKEVSAKDSSQKELLDQRSTVPEQPGTGTAPPTGSTGPTGPTGPADNINEVTGLPGGVVEVVTGANCREIYFEFESLLFRAREFPQSWGPSTAISGRFVDSSLEGEVLFVTSDGDEVLFYGGEGAMFTTDCPAY